MLKHSPSGWTAALCTHAHTLLHLPCLSFLTMSSISHTPTHRTRLRAPSPLPCPLQLGYVAARSHVDATALKTDCPLPTLVEVVRRLGRRER